MKKIILCTAKYSDNLGDGVIADCVGYLSASLIDAEILHLDISGRSDYAVRQDNKIPLSKKIFHLAPSYLKPLISWLGWKLIFKKRIRQKLIELDFSSSDRLIFGGGQLLSDVAWNFPLKISYICQQAEKSKVPYSFNAIGVSNHFSFVGRFLFKRVLKSKYMVYLSVRDAGCINNLLNLDVPAEVINETVDTGLWAKEAYSIVPPPQTCSKHRVGLGVSHPSELSMHTADGEDNNQESKFWVSLVKEFCERNYQPVLFTNGSNDDNAYLSKVMNDLKKAGSKVEVECFIPKTPKELVEKISQFDSLISHRLHANIVAHSLSIPTTALSWDRKVQSYCDLINRPQWCQSDRLNIKELVKLHENAIEQGLDITQINALKETSKFYLQQQLRT